VGVTAEHASRAAPAPQPVEQIRYARWLAVGTHAGMLVLVLLFVAYVSGLTTPQIPHERLVEVWGLPIDEFLRATGSPTGWNWVALAFRGDLATLAGVVLLLGASLPCLLALLPLYARRGDRIFLGICLAEVAVLLLAASGVLTAGR
jgi:hypothetical protein